MTTESEKSNFVHLHLHDEYSTLDGINRTETLPEYAKSLGMEAVAQTNHGLEPI